jgi:hypothetical protein
MWFFDQYERVDEEKARKEYERKNSDKEQQKDKITEKDEIIEKGLNNLQCLCEKKAQCFSFGMNLNQ